MSHPCSLTDLQDVVAVLNFGDDGEDAVSPETKTRLHEVEKLEAETVANRQKLNVRHQQPFVQGNRDVCFQA